MEKKPFLTEAMAQEIIQDVTLFTSQSAAMFYDKLFSSLDFTLPRATTGRRGPQRSHGLCFYRYEMRPIAKLGKCQ